MWNWGRTMILVAVVSGLTAQKATSADVVPVTVENFVRAESDLYLGGIIKESGSIGKFDHNREPAMIDDRTVTRLSRVTLHSSAVFNFESGPVTIMLPNAGDRFMSMPVISEDHYVPKVNYGAGQYKREGWPKNRLHGLAAAIKLAALCPQKTEAS